MGPKSVVSTGGHGAGGLPPPEYVSTSTNRAKLLEKELEKELNNMKVDLEDYESSHGFAPKSSTSSNLPQSVDYFRRLRQSLINDALQVAEGKPLKIQADAMKKEMLDAAKCEYTYNSVGFILHDFFVRSLRENVVSRYKHIMRWKRFIHNTRDSEKCAREYKARLSNNLAEFGDFSARAKRLAVVEEAFLYNKLEMGANAVTQEDMQIYTKHLVHRLHSVKKINQFYKIVQWLPFLKKMEISFDAIEAELEAFGRDKDSSDGDIEESQLGGRTTSTQRSRNDGGRLSISASSVITGTESHAASSFLPEYNAGGVLYSAPSSSAVIAHYVCEPNANESSLTVPYHMTNFEQLRPLLNCWVPTYNIRCDLEIVFSAADEMDLFSKVHKLFPKLFQKQQDAFTFPIYDTTEEGKQQWGRDCVEHAVLKPATWIEYITFTPHVDAGQEKFFTQLRAANQLDELLKLQSAFLSVKSAEQVQKVLKFQATSIRTNRVIEPSSVASHRCENKTHRLFLDIYKTESLFQKSDEVDVLDYDLEGSDAPSIEAISREKRARDRRKNPNEANQYDYSETLQLLGLDDGDANSDTVNLQGGYLSFIHLRHVRIRDLKRNCLAVLNYMRSLERTLTINDAGLTLDESLELVSQDKQDIPDYSLPTGPDPLDSHAYLYNTPADYQLSATKFMDHGDVDNHDDYYVIGGSQSEPKDASGAGRVHVQDQRGFYIMYDVAVEDLQRLEHDLLLLGSHFIQKERDTFKKSDTLFRNSRQNTFLGANGRQLQESHELSKNSHEMIDRMSVLFDLWNCEAQFLEKKQKLLDLYMECYHHTTDVDEQRALAQTIYDLMHQRPRIDPNAPYFVMTYRAEIVALSIKIDLVRQMMEAQVESQREYVSRICRDGDEGFGMPLNIIPKQPVLLHNNVVSLKPMYLLELHPSLAQMAHLEGLLRDGFQRVVDGVVPQSITETVILYKLFLEHAKLEWENMAPMGNSYSTNVQKELFADVFVEDPLFVCEIGHSMTQEDENSGGMRKSLGEKQAHMIAVWSRLLEIITLRHRLMETAWESEVLARLYRLVAQWEKHEEHHLYMRLVNFEFGQEKERYPPPFLSNTSEDDTSIDRFVPAFLSLGIHELDDKQVGGFNFRTRDGLMKLMSGVAYGVENLQCCVMAQLCTRNTVQVACELSINAAPLLTSAQAAEKKKTAKAMEEGRITSSKHHQAANVPRRVPEAFISIQMERAFIRDLMINEYLKKKSQNALLMRNPDEVEKIKRKLVTWFCEASWEKMTEYSAKSQIILHYKSLLQLLESYPLLRDNHFTIGVHKEKKQPEDDMPPQKLHQRSNFVKRPRRLLSSAGNKLLNLWFIPSNNEIMHSFRNLDAESRAKSCLWMVRIASSLHDICKLLAAHAMAGCSYARLGSNVNTVSAAWGGIEGIGTELIELQQQVDALEDPTDPEQVASFLELKRESMLLEFETAVRHPIRDQFMLTKNLRAYQALSTTMHYALMNMADIYVRSAFSGGMTTPLPLRPNMQLAQQLLPYRTFLDRFGSTPSMIESTNTIVNSVLLCFSCLRNHERQIANGEILGISLLLEDVLQTGDHNFALVDHSERHENEESSSPTPSKRVPLSKTKQPVEAHKMCKKMLVLWKRLEYFRHNWALHRMGGLVKLTSVSQFQDFRSMYRRDVFYPTVRTLARKYSQLDHYLNSTIGDNDPIAIPRGCSEVELRVKLVVKLIDTFECRLMDAMKKRISLEHAKLLSEKSREEGALPTDIWKKPAIKEQFTLVRPHIAEGFERQLQAARTLEDDSTITFDKDQLRSAFNWLGNAVMERERQSYESYSMFYENLLKHKSGLLYKAEQEKEQLKESMKEYHRNSLVDSQCRLAEECYSLVMEVTALRTQLAEKDEALATEASRVRQAVKVEFMELIHDLFNACYNSRDNITHYQTKFYSDASELVLKTGDEVRQKIAEMKDKVSEADEFNKNTLVEYKDQILDLQNKNTQMESSIRKQKSFYKWKLAKNEKIHDSQLSEDKADLDKARRERLVIQLLAEEEVGLLRQQQVALKLALATSENSQQQLQSALLKEQMTQMELEHEKQQRARSDKQMETTKAENMENLLAKLEESESRFRNSLVERTRLDRANEFLFEKSSKAIDHLKRTLATERSVKQDAISRLDNYTGGDDVIASSVPSKSRPHTAASSMMSVGFSRKSASRPNTGYTSGYSSLGTAPASGSHGIRPITTDGGTRQSAAGGGKSGPPGTPVTPVPSAVIQRPKTSHPRLQSVPKNGNRIYRQLLADEGYADHDSLVELNSRQGQL